MHFSDAVHTSINRNFTWSGEKLVWTEKEMKEISLEESVLFLRRSTASLNPGCSVHSQKLNTTYLALERIQAKAWKQRVHVFLTDLNESIETKRWLRIFWKLVAEEKLYFTAWSCYGHFRVKWLNCRRFCIWQIAPTFPFACSRDGFTVFCTQRPPLLWVGSFLGKSDVWVQSENISLWFMTIFEYFTYNFSAGPAAFSRPPVTGFLVGFDRNWPALSRPKKGSR